MKRVILCAIAGSLSALVVNAQPLSHFRDCDACPEMIELPLSSFVIGTPVNQRGSPTLPDSASARGNEGPAHQVFVDLRFAMGENEITFDDYMACVDDGSCNAPRYGMVIAIGMGTPEQVERAVTDPRFKHTPFEKIIARDHESFMGLRLVGRSPVIEVTYLDAQAYVSWLNRKLGIQAYRLSPADRGRVGIRRPCRSDDPFRSRDGANV